jgi:hypothetical protein
MHHLITDHGKGIGRAARGGYVVARHTHRPESPSRGEAKRKVTCMM